MEIAWGKARGSWPNNRLAPSVDMGAPRQIG